MCKGFLWGLVWLFVNRYRRVAIEFQGEAGGGVSFLHDFNGLAKKPIRQKGNAEAKKMRRCPPLR